MIHEINENGTSTFEILFNMNIKFDTFVDHTNKQISIYINNMLFEVSIVNHLFFYFQFQKFQIHSQKR